MNEITSKCRNAEIYLTDAIGSSTVKIEKYFTLFGHKVKTINKTQLQESDLLNTAKLLKNILKKVFTRLLYQVASEFMRVEFLVVISPIKKRALHGVPEWWLLQGESLAVHLYQLNHGVK